MRITLFTWASVIVVIACFMGGLVHAAENNVVRRETVLNKKTHTEKNVVLDIPRVAPLCDSIRGLKREKIDIGGCKFYCEQEGKGVPIVLVSGGPGCTHHIFHPYFSQAAKYARVIYYDQRGTGRSDMDGTGEKYTVRQAVEDLDCLRKALKIDKWIVLGHSYGGFLAQCYALEHPDRVLGLMLVCAKPGTPNMPLNETRQWDYMTDEETAKVSSIFTNGKLTEEQQVYNAHMNGDWKRQYFYRPSNDNLARMARYEWKPGPGFRERMGPDIFRIDLKGRFDNFDISTLIIEAKWDLTWNTDKPAKMLENHPGAEMVVLNRSGHSPFMDEPDRFFGVIKDFADKVKHAPAPKPGRKGKGVPWVSALAHKIDMLEWTGEDKRALEAFTEAKKASLGDSEAWFKLGMVLYDGKHYTEALDAFCRLSSAGSSQPSDKFIALVWQGHLLDLLGRREEAIEDYRQALKINIDDIAFCHDQYGMVVDRQWVEERLKTPFERR